MAAKPKKAPATKTRGRVLVVPTDGRRPTRYGWKFYITDHLMASSGATYTRARQARRAFDRFRARVAQGRFV
jgi:hypothetical protein